LGGDNSVIEVALEFTLFSGLIVLYPCDDVRVIRKVLDDLVELFS
jgi:hypothetical protein